MIEILKFVFSSFWVWLGSFLMLGLVGQVLCALCGCGFSLIRIGGNLISVGSSKKTDAKQ